MKKVLFATTALIATAGVASADIAISGDGRMGIVNTETATAGDAEATFNSRLRFTLTASGVTDGGLSFGGAARIDQYDENTDAALSGRASGSNAAAAGAAADRGTAGSVYVSGAFGKITMGDIGSAHESATGDLHGVGLTLSSNEMGYAGGGDDTGVAYSYTTGNFTIYASMGQRQDTSANNENGLGVSYNMNGITIAAGTADDGTVEESSFAISGTVAGVGLKAIMLDRDNSTTSGEVGFSASYAVDSNLSLSAFTRSVEYTNAGDREYTGVGFAYNLGGGASLKGGFTDGGGSTNALDAMDLGLSFSF